MTASTKPNAPESVSINWRSDVAVVVCLAVALVAGWLYKGAVQSQTERIEDALTGLRLNVPAGWQVDQQVPNVILAASDGNSASTFKTKLTVVSRQIDASAALDADKIIERVVQKHEQDLLGYHLLGIDPVNTLPADKARVISYAYVVQPESVDRPFQASLPVVVQSADYLYFAADRYFIITLAADSQEFDRHSQDFELILKSVDIP